MKKRLLCIFLVLSFVVLTIAASADENVLIDNGDVLVKIKSMETSGDTFTMKVLLENRSNVTLMFSIDGTVVNGYEADPFWASEVSPGKKSNETISIRRLSEKGITGDVTSISFTMRAYDSNNWSSPDLFKESFTLYPLGEEKAVTEERKPGANDVVIADNKNVTITAIGYGMDNTWGYQVNLYIVNKTNKTIMVSVDDTSINGFMVDPFWATEVPPNARSFETINFSKRKLEENDISSVEEIETTFRVYDSNDWSAGDLFKGSVVLKP